MTEWLTSQPGWLQALIRVLLFVGPLLIIVPGLIWWERRLLSWMQDRIGPNRVGPFGLLQPIADGIKLFFKEDITPSAVDRAIYFLAPAIALFPAFALGGTIPWGPLEAWTPIANVDIGVLYILAISSLGVYGVVLAGYSSNNKYSLLGGLRSAAQLISYELAMGMALAAVVLASGSLKLTEMVKIQEGPLWGISDHIQNWFLFTPWGFVAAVIFAICIVAETNRAPFDLPEAENELIAGYHTEYSSMKFAVFFMGEYAAMLVFSGVFACVFLGGYNMLPINWSAFGENSVTNALTWANTYLAPAWFSGKCAFGMTIFIWLRATLPRLRYDQLMSLGWKSLLPLGVANFMLAGLWSLLSTVKGAGYAWVVWAGAAVLLMAIFISVRRVISKGKNTLETRTIRLVDAEPVASPPSEGAATPA
ncbi:MAG TPA: NADH-quinone oxidoreductase subunit NuoH [Fimbriimonadaceae bacterium]|nr:NADH-quinone oxidoreductase subunit NuoH [Fimbriimonadaceae bacterium]